MTYTVVGKLATLKDARGNLTTYEYDGYNRPSKTRYPKPASGGTSAATGCSAASQDYCDIINSYDANGNALLETRRDGAQVANTYDALNRLKTKTGSTIVAIANTYDNLDHLLTASNANATVTWTYDALGRATSEAQSNGTVTSSYDAAGRRTQLSYPGGFTLTYASNDAGELTAISQSGTGVLATFHSDDVGRPDAVARTGGGSTGYGYDAASRLALLAHGGLGANNQTIGLGYNPAGQIVSRSSSNTAYDWPYAAAFTDSYGTANGLNQYPTARGSAISYDDRGTSEPAGRSTGNRSRGPISGGEGHGSGPPMTGPRAMLTMA